MKEMGYQADARNQQKRWKSNTIKDAEDSNDAENS